MIHSRLYETRVVVGAHDGTNRTKGYVEVYIHTLFWAVDHVSSAGRK